ncbi:hypothetical protein M501DRAFT_164193 [Patellaria atrata CBS 101060]|uniref:Transmembrane protein n=1 Tax=Patellaria atrata CBS 101060 TaxID=1346257 RepID=A0A9P4VQ41_9PEZI|nr:hypothetical protein M501DRAFT_164193 [Patellaria atrata CBS 101060]
MYIAFSALLIFFSTCYLKVTFKSRNIPSHLTISFGVSLDFWPLKSHDCFVSPRTVLDIQYFAAVNRAVRCPQLYCLFNEGENKLDIREERFVGMAKWFFLRSAVCLLLGLMPNITSIKILHVKQKWMGVVSQRVKDGRLLERLSHLTYHASGSMDNGFLDFPPRMEYLDVKS